MIDNIVIGNPIEGLTLEDLDILPTEETLFISMDIANEFNMFLPSILVHAGLFKTNSEVKRIHKDRVKSTKIKDKNSRELWRTIDKPEFTHFKIGKRSFWLLVGE